MKSPLLLPFVFCCLAGAALAVEPDASPSPSPALAKHHHHRRRHHAETATASPTPAESPAPKKHWTLESVLGPSRFAAKPAPAPEPAPPPASAASPARAHHWGIGNLNPFARHPKAPEPMPTPVPSPAPHPKTHKHHKRTTAAEAEPTPASSPDETTPAPPAESQATPEPKPKRKGSSITSQVPFVAPEGVTPEKVHTPEPTRSPVKDEAERTQRFQQVKSKALTDQKVRDLQAKADNASGDDERTALRQYYKALYGRMREIDPSLHERIQRTEAASLRRADSQAGQ